MDQQTYEDAHKWLDAQDHSAEKPAVDEAEIKREPAESSEPAENAVLAAAKADAEKQAADFTESFHMSDEDRALRSKPVEPEIKAPANFKDAFAQARKDGLKVFDYNGKKFTTELKSAAKPVAKPASNPAVQADTPVQSMAAKPAAKAPMAMPNDEPAMPMITKPGANDHFQADGQVKGSPAKVAPKPAAAPAPKAERQVLHINTDELGKNNALMGAK